MVLLWKAIMWVFSYRATPDAVAAVTGAKKRGTLTTSIRQLLYIQLATPCQDQCMLLYYCYTTPASATLWVCMCVRALKEKRLELATLKSVDSTAGRLHALTLRPNGQRSKLQGYQTRCRCGSAGRYDCSRFYNHHHFIRQDYTYIKKLVKEYSWQDIPGSKSTYSSLR